MSHGQPKMQGCRATGKRRYRDHAHAVRQLKSIANKIADGTQRGEPPVRAYRCPECKGWHLTRRPETR